MSAPVRIGGCEVWHGDCLDVLRGMAEASVDSVVTDPPAGISFMSKSWDGDKGGRDAWIAWMREVAAECLRVVKPGAHALVWALPRTSHWTATAWEDAGWTVRDRVSHLFGTGFPKSLDVGKAIDKAAGAERQVVGFGPDHSKRTAALGRGGTVSRSGGDAPVGQILTAPATPEAARWAGWGTALKPAVEDWWLLRKPLACPTVAAQVLATGTGALNVDGCRIAGTGNKTFDRFAGDRSREQYRTGTTGKPIATDTGRWPANLVTDGSPEVLEAFAAFGPAGSNSGKPAASDGTVHREGHMFARPNIGPSRAEYDTRGESAARFFPALGYGEDELRFHYSAKANRQERAGSKHPCVKPQSLLRWLARLITPPGGTILDPFAGSGSLGQAALAEGFNAILIERELEYIEDIRRRLDNAKKAHASADNASRLGKREQPRDDGPLFADAAA